MRNPRVVWRAAVGGAAGLLAVLGVGQAVSMPALAGKAAVELPGSSSPTGDPAYLASAAAYSAGAMAKLAPVTASAPGWSHVAQATGTPAASSHLEISLGMVGRDPAGLARYDAALSEKASPVYHDFLTANEYDQLFGAEPARTTAAVDWLRSGGLKVDYISKSGTAVEAGGTIAQVGRLFGVSFRDYDVKGHRFVSAVGTPQVPAVLGARAVLGLDNYPYYQSLGTPDQPSGLSPQDLWSIYDMPGGPTGSYTDVDAGQGQKLASFSEGSTAYIESDLRQFESVNNLPQMPFNFDIVGAPGTDTSGLAEFDLDSQAASSMAPEADSYTMYVANNQGELSNAVQAWADDPAGSLQSSLSFGVCDQVAAQLDLLGTVDMMDAAITQAYSEGRSIFVSAGDSGAGCIGAENGVNSPLLGTEYPASSTYSVGVGGTTIITNGDTPPQRELEYAWTAGGGGMSNMEPAPPWQTGVVSPTSAGSSGIVPAQEPCVINADLDPYTTATACKAVPDVTALSGDAAQGYNIIVQGQAAGYGGTSLAAPLWQGMWARVQADAPLNSSGVAAGLGQAASDLYSLYRSPLTGAATPNPYSESFYDVTVGDNGPYPATPGWDYTSGLGVGDVIGLIDNLDQGNLTPTDPTGAAAPSFAPASGSGTGTAAEACTLNPQMAPGSTSPSSASLIYSFLGEPDPTGVTDSADLTLESAGFTYNPGANPPSTGVLTATITVQGLASDPRQGAPGALGDLFEANFSIDGAGYALMAARQTADQNTPPDVDPSASAVYSFATQSGADSFPTVVDSSNQTGSTITGSFDTSDNTITINLPESAFDAYLDTTASQASPAIAGSELTDLSASSSYSWGVLAETADTITPVEDAGDCYYQAPGTAYEVTPPTTGGSGSGSGGSGGSASDVGQTCPGGTPLWTQSDPTDSYPPSEAGVDTPQLDLTEGDMGMGTNGNLVTVVHVSQYPSTVPPPGQAIDYFTDFTYNGTEYFSDAQVDAADQWAYADGTEASGTAGGTLTFTSTDLAGSVTPDPNGDGGAIIKVSVPLADIGQPPAGTVLTDPSASAEVYLGVPNALSDGSLPTAGAWLAADGAGGPGYNYPIGADCGLSSSGGDTTAAASADPVIPPSLPVPAVPAGGAARAGVPARLAL